MTAHRTAALILSLALLLIACANAPTRTLLAPVVVRVSRDTTTPVFAHAASPQPPTVTPSFSVPSNASPSATPNTVGALFTAPPQSSDWWLTITAIGVESPVISVGWHTERQQGQAVAAWDDPGNNVGYVISSAPLGSVGNTVLMGHNNVSGAVFRRLADLPTGAVITVHTADQTWDYQVAEVLIVLEAEASPEQRAANLSYLDPTLDNRLTLISCWPEASNTHRVVVIAYPAP